MQGRMCIKQYPEDWDSAQCTSSLSHSQKNKSPLDQGLCNLEWWLWWKVFICMLSGKNLLFWVILKWKIHGAADEAHYVQCMRGFLNRLKQQFIDKGINLFLLKPIPLFQSLQRAGGDKLHSLRWARQNFQNFNQSHVHTPYNLNKERTEDTGPIKEVFSMQLSIINLY